MKSQVYNQAKYYEIAFSFINPKKQADLFEGFIKKYSRVEVKTVLDLACGTALQLRELSKRGYISIGLDVNFQMLDYLKKISRQEGCQIKTVRADINKFKLKQKADFAYIMMGSITYASTNELFLAHLYSVANSLKSGGLYLIENLAINWADPAFLKPQSWIMKQDGIKIKTTYQILPTNPLKQIVTQILKMEVNDRGRKMEFIDRDEVKIIFPEEFKLLIEKSGKFEFLGFFEKSRVKLLNKISADNIALLRKK